MSTLIKGDTCIFYIWDGVDSYDPVACLTSNSLSETRNIIESQTKCEPGVIQKTAGSYTYEISLEGEAIVSEAGKNSHLALRDYIDGTTGTVEWKLDNGETAGSTAYYGTGILSELTLDAAAGDEIATFSATLVGDSTGIVTTAPNP